jgi:hypothetical protein
MNHSYRKPISLICAAGLLSCALLGTAHAQDTTSSTTRTGAPAVTTQVRSGTVIYVSGNDLIVKVDDGTIKHFVVPDSTRVTVGGKSLSVHQLTPGMTLTRTITTTATPTYVETVRTITGKVWYVAPPRTLILSFPDGPNKQYKVPDGTMFDVDGKKQSIFHVRKGMTISATIVKDVPETIATSTTSVSGVAPPAPPATPPATPTIVGVLLIEPIAPPPPPADVAQNTLPKTGSIFPLLGLLGALLLGVSFGARALRSR